LRSKNVAPLIKLDVPSGVKTQNIPFGVPVPSNKEIAKNHSPSGRYNFDLDQSISSYDLEDGKLAKIKEVDENFNDSSSSSHIVKSAESSKRPTFVQLDDINVDNEDSNENES
jgi:hypothetical protein